MYLPEPEVAKLSTVWDLFGEAGRDLSYTFSQGWQLWGDYEFAA